MKIFKYVFPINLLCILLFSAACDRKAIQNESKYVIELIGPELDQSKIKLIAKRNDVKDTQLYQWKNHVVLFSPISRIEDFYNQLVKELPDAQVKIYDKPFYNFSKSERCDNSAIAPEWKHILLTANLVENKKLQQEYIDYHHRQFTEWPEISQGFCNADFQQLLLYKNGRQLMLIISIPADKTLNELNPKTTENNPRMDEWNQIMGKYQEGIKGTEPGEKWVFFHKIE
jgi:hypothetical protein